MTATCKYMNSEGSLQTGYTVCTQICRKTRHRLPSGFGTVRFLGKGRRRPYAVHPPAEAVEIEASDEKEISESFERPEIGSSSDGLCAGREIDARPRRIWKRPPAICYVSTREIGRRILRLYHAGEYRAGMEREIEQASAREQNEKSAGDLPAPDGVAIALDGVSRTSGAAGSALGTAGSAPDAVRPAPDADGIVSGTVGLSFDAAVPAFGAADPALDAVGPASDEAGTVSDAAGSASNTVGPASDEGGPVSAAGSTPPDNHSVASASALPETLPSAPEPEEGSFAETYAAFYEHKFGAHANRNLSKSTRNATNAAYKKFAPLYHVPIDDITVDGLQDIVNGAADNGYSKSAVRQMVTLTHQLYKYAFPRELCKKDCGRYVEMPGCTAEEEHHQDFTDAELKILWKNYRKTGDPIVRMILVMCYSGFRIGEFEDSTFRVCLPEEVLQSGGGTQGQDNVPQQIAGTSHREALQSGAGTSQQAAAQSGPCSPGAEKVLQQGTGGTGTSQQTAAQRENGTAQSENVEKASAVSRPTPRRRSKKAKVTGSPAYFQGGLKTEAGRNRIVPIHSAILPLVLEMLDPAGKPVFFCGRKSGWFRRKMKDKLVELGIDTPAHPLPATTSQTTSAASPHPSPAVPDHTAPADCAQTPPAAPDHTSHTDCIQISPAVRAHTPHSTRHTFSRLCESYGVGDADRRRMLGHSFGSDITNGVYGHRSVRELKEQIEKIRAH